MENKTKKTKAPRWTEITLGITVTFYIWYLASTLLVPLKEFLNLPEGVYLTSYKMIGFPPAILGFIICVSLISTIMVILEFNGQKEKTKIFLAESISFMLYFIIPIIATIALIIIIFLGISGQVPTQAKISYLLEDLFLFTSALFILTAILNVATLRIIKINTKASL